MTRRYARMLVIATSTMLALPLSVLTVEAGPASKAATRTGSAVARSAKARLLRIARLDRCQRRVKI